MHKLGPARASGGGAVLTLAAAPGFALEIQHRSTELIEALNRGLGWPCIARLRILQTEGEDGGEA